MQLGMVGLGKMGANMVRRLMAAGHECVVFDLDPEAVGALFAQDNAEGKHYRNCLCALMLEVYYRYLPGTS